MKKEITVVRHQLVDELEMKYSSGLVSRNRVPELKGGKGHCTIYKDKVPDPELKYLDEKHPADQVYEAGKIVVDESAIIGDHLHNEDWEIYIVLIGRVESNGKIYEAGEIMFCEKGQSHYLANRGEGEAIIAFIKGKEAA